jgi:hypothetical protein
LQDAVTAQYVMPEHASQMRQDQGDQQKATPEMQPGEPVMQHGALADQPWQVGVLVKACLAQLWLDRPLPSGNPD